VSAVGRLDRRTVVVTRAGGGPDALSDRLRELGADVRELPAIAFTAPADPGPLDAALRGLTGFDWVVFASATAVERVLDRLAELGLSPEVLAGRALAAVGPATAERLRSRLRVPELVPGDATGQGLARALAPSVRGRRVLLPRPAEGRPEILQDLAAAGAEVSAVEAYRTVPAPPERLACLGAWIRGREVDAVAFASPSAVRAAAEALGPDAPVLGRVLLAAIGPTTARALRDLGLAPGAVAERHTGRDLAEAIAARLGPG
jgi:uroporphyrinogen-III synthase/uroporphyrinogen III methyltransferase/synthase